MDATARNRIVAAASEAKERLDEAVAVGQFPDIQGNLLQLQSDLADLRVDPAGLSALESAQESVDALYRVSMSKMNAAPQKYQQPVFRCYSDYQKCAFQEQSQGGKALCIMLFVLALADNLITISLPGK